jgi:hypothetical protein
MKKSFLVFLLILSQPYSLCYAKQQYTSVEDFIATQKTIRVVFIDQGGFGDMAASANVMARLREKEMGGFSGLFEAIYEDDAVSLRDMSILFNLPPNVPDVYYDTKTNTRFIKAGEFVRRSQLNQNERVTLAISGWCHARCHKDSYNVDMFFSPDNSENVSSSITYYFSNTQKRFDIDISNTYFTTHVIDFNQTVNYLYNDPQGQQLLIKKPALNTFIDGMENKKFNVLPIYGFRIRAPQPPDGQKTDNYIEFMLEIIAGARYAQVNGLTDDWHKPLVLTVYYDYLEEANVLNNLIHSKDWGEYEGHGAAEARSVLTQLGLDQSTAFSVADISDPNTIDTINNLKTGQILLLSMGSFPKDVFDSLYTHTNNNIWPQIREGDSSFSSLVLTGKPHFRCGMGGWGPGFDLIKDPTLKMQLENFYLDSPDIFCGMHFKQVWDKNNKAYVNFGKFIIDSSNPDSALSQYFQTLKNEASKKDNDRIYATFREGLKLYNNQ